MSTMRRLQRMPRGLLASAALLLSSVASAQIGSPPVTQALPTLFAACMVPGSGTVYLRNEPWAQPFTGAPNGCRESHLPFAWNAKGLQGERGPRGYTGDSGVMRVYYKERSRVYYEGEGIRSEAVLCEAGDKIIGGGFRYNPTRDTSPPIVVSSFPNINAISEGQTGSGWTVFAEGAGKNAALDFFAVCVASK